MAINDVKHYFYTMLVQYLEEKSNLADFEEALKAGQITEEEMRDALTVVESLEVNYHRLAYIMYLLDMPNKQSKKAVYTRQYKKILDELEHLGADLNSVKKENADALIHFKASLEALKNKEMKDES